MNRFFRRVPRDPEVNAEREEGDPSSILNFYRRCLALRKNNKTLLSGAYREYFHNSRKLYVYERYAEDERFLVICSFSDRKEKVRLPKGFDDRTAELVLCNYPEPESGIFSPFRPYEVRVLRWE